MYEMVCRKRSGKVRGDRRRDVVEKKSKRGVTGKGWRLGIGIKSNGRKENDRGSERRVSVEEKE
ncbi:hypothetical protein [Pasteurella multocida]|uniref:hypothetical protein n=1 Tax=Pasteurella multocida TaxID=747 RepID=UPI00146133E2|nr:hypothetical protein [Pasteurella multocida]NMR52218.1 hypothetical protein [Pasteurella multocida]NMR62158.1 hypothetical protein [Pasteurella multocida]